MKNIFILFLFHMLFFPFLSADDRHPVSNSFEFSDFLFESLPGSYFPSFFLENYAPDITLMIEENNGFSFIDHPRVYFEGEPFTHFNWYYDGFNLNSALEPGKSALQFPFSGYSGYALQGINPYGLSPGLWITSTDFADNSARISVSSVFSDLGSYTPLGPVIIQPEHPSLRDEMLYNTRRRINSNYFADALISRKAGKGVFSIGMNHYFIQRDFNDFRETDSQFSENGRYLVLSATYKQFTRTGRIEILSAYSNLTRDNLFAELGRYPQETSAYNKDTLFAGFRFLGKKLASSVSVTLERVKTDPYISDYSIDIFDNDGDDIMPLNTYGIFKSVIMNGEFNYALSASGHFRSELFGKVRFSQLNSTEYTNRYNEIYAGNSPYQIVIWNDVSTDSINSNVNLVSGINFSRALGRSSYLTGNLNLVWSALSFRGGVNNLSSLAPGFDLAFQSSSKNSRFYLGIGHAPVELRESLNHFLDQSKPSAAVYYWNDLNNDLGYQPGEESGIYSYTGNPYHRIAPGFKTPVRDTVNLLYSLKISRNFTFNLKALYKQFKNTPWVMYDGDYGMYESAESHDLYVLKAPPEDFVLTNYAFDKNPFYAQLLINFTAEIRKRWFFSFSFMAHMGMGYAAFGNGPGSNDIGIISESMANPNTWTNGFGRLDGDRGFVSKLFFGFSPAKNLFLGVSIKYRDGDPFAFLNRSYIGNQWILYYSTIQAEDEFGVKGGPREDFVSDLSFKLSYNFRMFRNNASLWFSFFNVIDLGSELSEYVLSGGERYAMELQLPKSLRLGLSFEL